MIKMELEYNYVNDGMYGGIVHTIEIKNEEYQEKSRLYWKVLKQSINIEAQQRFENEWTEYLKGKLPYRDRFEVFVRKLGNIVRGNNYYDDFRNNVFSRHESNQWKAKRIWIYLRQSLTLEEIASFKTEWNHYLIGELDYEQFGFFVKKLKEDLFL